jgi:hypothetical protein
MARLFGEGHGESVEGILARALGRRGISHHVCVPLGTWREAVGPALADRARPTALSRGVLHLEVQDQRWRDQIDAARALIIERFNRRLGRRAVRALQFGPAKPRAHGSSSRPPAPAGPPLEASGLPEDVRDAFARAAVAARSRRA